MKFFERNFSSEIVTVVLVTAVTVVIVTVVSVLKVTIVIVIVE